MAEPYLPPSDFLKTLIGDDPTLVSGDHSKENLARLIEMTRDGDPANRDWATLLLAQQDIDTCSVRDALLNAAEDEREYVRAEAILGLAQRDKALALPLLQRELRREHVGMPLFEAARLVADPSLADDLREFANPSDNSRLDELAIEALAACEVLGRHSG